MKRPCVHTEWRMNDVSNADRTKAIGLRNAGDEGGIERSKQCSYARPEGGCDHVRRAGAEELRDGGSNIRAHVIGMPERCPYGGGVFATGDDGQSSQVRRVGFEDIRSLGVNSLANLVEAAQQMVRAVVRKGGALDSKDTRAAIPAIMPGMRGRGACVELHFFISRPRCNHRVVVSKLAQNVTPGR